MNHTPQPVTHSLKSLENLPSFKSSASPSIQNKSTSIITQERCRQKDYLPTQFQLNNDGIGIIKSDIEIISEQYFGLTQLLFKGNTQKSKEKENHSNDTGNKRRNTNAEDQSSGFKKVRMGGDGATVVDHEVGNRPRPRSKRR